MLALAGLLLVGMVVWIVALSEGTTGPVGLGWAPPDDEEQEILQRMQERAVRQKEALRQMDRQMRELDRLQEQAKRQPKKQPKNPGKNKTKQGGARAEQSPAVLAIRVLGGAAIKDRRYYQVKVKGKLTTLTPAEVRRLIGSRRQQLKRLEILLDEDSVLETDPVVTSLVEMGKDNDLFVKVIKDQ